jgi:peptidoglycan/xylan/chitin deacetylase (PgdA/CDA1 family)
LGYDLDSLDWTDPGAAAVRRNLAAASAGSIVSLHLGHRGTVDAMPRILDDLARRGLRPVTALELLR